MCFAAAGRGRTPRGPKRQREETTARLRREEADGDERERDPERDARTRSSEDAQQPTGHEHRREERCSLVVRVAGRLEPPCSRLRSLRPRCRSRGARSHG